jgi:hypothetical protein
MDTTDPSAAARASAIEIGVGEGVGVGGGEAEGSGVEGVGVGDGRGDGTGVGDGSGLGGAVVAVGSGVGVGLCDGTVGDPRFCGEGPPWMNQSDALSFVSVAFPAVAPGNRSRLEPAGGARAATPSTKPFVASPQPTASMTDPPTTRNATAPPVAAIPPLYVASADAAYLPEALPMRKRWPGLRTRDASQEAFRVTVDPDEVA